MSILPRACAILYEHYNYEGWAMNSGDHFPSDRNDEVTSIRVTYGCTIIIYEHDNYDGQRRTITSDTPNLGSDWNDRLSSYTCSCRYVSVAYH